MTYRKLPPIPALAAFEAVARHLSFSKAAQELHLTHSAVSQRIGVLEGRLGAKLFVRTNRSVALTPAGQQYLGEVRHALDQLAHASEKLSERGRKTLRINVALAFATHWLAPRLPQYQGAHPDVDVDVFCSNDVVDVRAGEADIGLRFGNGRWPGLKTMRLLSGELFPVCSPKLRRGAAAIRVPADLARVPLLRHNAIPWTPWFRAAGLDWGEPSRGPLFNDSTFMLQAAAEGQGVALARGVFADALLRSRRLIRLFNVAVKEDKAFYAVYAESSLARPEVAGFVTWLEQHRPPAAGGH